MELRTAAQYFQSAFHEGVAELEQLHMSGKFAKKGPDSSATRRSFSAKQSSLLHFHEKEEQLLLCETVQKQLLSSYSAS